MSTSTHPQPLTRPVPFADLSIGQMFIMHGTVHAKKSPTSAVNCLNLGIVRVTEQTTVEIP